MYANSWPRFQPVIIFFFFNNVAFLAAVVEPQQCYFPFVNRIFSGGITTAGMFSAYLKTDFLWSFTNRHCNPRTFAVVPTVGQNRRHFPCLGCFRIKQTFS